MAHKKNESIALASVTADRFLHLFGIDQISWVRDDTYWVVYAGGIIEGH
jgi:hypothetical protein